MNGFRNKNLIFFSTILIFFFANARGQDYISDLNKKKDSLRDLIQNTGSDTTKCKALTELIELEEDIKVWPAYNQQLQSICEEQLQNHKPQTALHRFYLERLGDAINNKGYLANVQGDIPAAMKFFQRSVEIFGRLENKKGMANALSNLATVYQYQGDIQRSLDYNYRSLDLFRQIDDKIGIAESFNNLGLIYDYQGDTQKALDSYHKALKIQEQIGDKKNQAATLNNIGQIYKQQDDTARALRYYLRSLKVNEEIGERLAMAGCFHNIAHIYYEQKNIPLAVEYFEKSYSISESSGYKAGMAHTLSSLAGLYGQQGDTSRGLDLWNRSLRLREELNDQQGIAMSLNNLAQIYINKDDLATAERLSLRSLQIARALGFPADIKEASGHLRHIYSKRGDWKNAYEMLELYKKMNDSANKIEDRKTALQMSFQYEYGKKTATDSIKAVEERKVFNAQIRQQKAQRTALYIVIGLITLFAFFMFNRFRVTQKQKRIIEAKEKETQLQKFIIEQKHKEISDSINYAERIQRSFLASEEMLTSNLPEYFIFFKPKDVVSGDFYWATHLANGHFAFAVADSTGHGVPGAIMSLLNISGLEKAAELQNDPEEILNHTRKTIIQRLQKDGSAEGGKDGMDCSLLVFDFLNLKLHVAAANNPVWIIRKVNSKVECIETIVDKMPVGKHDNDQVNFTRQTLHLQKGDMIYALTDGFADQFGGPRGKKFMSKRLKDLLTSIAHEHASEQKTILTKTLNDWQAGLEQVDDMTIAGIRIC